MDNSHLSEHLKDKENFKRFQEDALLLDVASLINGLMKRKNVTRTQLADRLDVTKGRISQYLGGERNLTLRTLADIFVALNCKCHFSADEFCESEYLPAFTAEAVQVVQRPPHKWDFIAECLKDGTDLQLAG